MRWAVAIALIAAGMLPAIACRKGTNTEPGADSAPIIHADSDAHPSTLASATASSPPPPKPAPEAACAVAYGGWAGGPSPGDDLSAVAVPLRVPAGETLTISVRRSGHLVRITGPAAVRPCTHEEADVVLVASGAASTDASAPVRPGAELFLSTPAFVAVVGKAAARIVASPTALSTWEIDAGDVTITNLDTTRVAHAGDKGSLKRAEDGGVLLTRCGVQAAAAAGAERLLLGSVQGHGAPLPSASIGILTAQQIKHARERVLDCAFAEAFGLACDVAGPAPAPPGCGSGGYEAVRAHVAKAVASAPIPPGSPAPPAATP